MRPGPLLLLALLLPLVPAAPAGAQDAASRVRIAILDTGVNPAHGEFEPGQVVAWKDFIGGRAAPYDDQGHGTATASLAAGRNAATCGAEPKLSYAPGALLVVGKVLDSANRLRHDRLGEAIDWAVAQGARVVSLSIGDPGMTPVLENATVGPAVARATAAGVLVVVSSGNGAVPVVGPLPGVGFVGRTEPSGLPWPSWARDFGNMPGTLVVGPASRHGFPPLRGQHLDPDVTSWGVDVCAAWYRGGLRGGWVGSSFAAPLVAGMAARAMELAEEAGAPSDGQRIRRLLMLSAHNAPGVPLAQEGLGFMLDTAWARARAHAAAGTLPDYDAQGTHARLDREQHDALVPLLRGL